MNNSINWSEFKQTLTNTQQTLLSERNEQGFWEGELSSSALSTATAVCALSKCLQHTTHLTAEQETKISNLVTEGRRWLADHQNADGGWGDTTNNFSNISTTAICWSAFADEEENFKSTTEQAAAWIEARAGGLAPQTLTKAIKKRYGKDHTFSVPILTTMALHGRLGDSRQAWKLIPQLPFELAACPHQWFAMLKLPVVSYALPALIAIGLVRHKNAPTWNPISRLLRRLTKRRVLRVLNEIQPPSGGFLEATPLTSFVLLGLLGAGEQDCPVVQSGIDFLVQSARPDGSWPIDTNLATWVSTLSINSLPDTSGLSDNKIQTWLLDQQYRTEHPYTHSPPGGWAWTDLTGGVPDADDTPGALLALKKLAHKKLEPKTSDESLESAIAGVSWLLGQQNSDGGMPTFCRGWGTLPFDRSSCDITAHSLRAWAAWKEQLPPTLISRTEKATRKALAYLTKQQRPDGAWPPLWFGNQHAKHEDEANLTYGTSRVLIALVGLPSSNNREASDTAFQVRHGIEWFLATQNEDNGWGGASQTPSTIEETALAVEALAVCYSSQPASMQVMLKQAIEQAINWLTDATEQGTSFPASPIGFYFAKLWYHEKMYPMVYTMGAFASVQRIETLLTSEQTTTV